MIRILHVVTNMDRGGLETFLMNYYRNIDKNRIQFDFLVHRKERADYDDEIEELGGIIYRISRLNPFSFKYIQQLNSFFFEHPEYKIVHVHQDCMSSIILKSAMDHGIKVRIAHSHSSNQTVNWKYPIKMYFRHYIPKYATHLAACSNAAGDWMFNGKKYELVHNAIDTSLYAYSVAMRSAIRKELNLNNEIVIGHVGRFAEVKNHAFLIDVFEEIRKRVPAKLLLVGDGYLRPQIEKQIQNKGLRKDVIMVGVREDVYRYLQAMDVFIFPSLFEGLPVSLIEAQASGLPCIISERVSIESSITKLVKQLDLAKGIKDWAGLAIELSKDERLNTAIDVKKQGYDIKYNAVKLMNFYESLLY